MTNIQVYDGFIESHPFYASQVKANRSERINQTIQEVVASTPLSGRVSFEIPSEYSNLVKLHINLSNLKVLSNDPGQLNANNTKVRNLLNAFITDLRERQPRYNFCVESIDLSSNVVSGRSLLAGRDNHYLLDENLLYNVNTVNFNDTCLSEKGKERFGDVPNITSINDDDVQLEW